MAQAIPRGGREAFARDLMARLRPLPGIERVMVHYLDEDPETCALVQSKADRADVLIELGAAGLVEEVRGALARFRREWDFDVHLARYGSVEVIWGDKERPTRQTIWAAGATMEEALEELKRSQGWGDIEHVTLPSMSDDEKQRGFTWAARFTAGGTSMKAAGWHRTAIGTCVGLYAVTWWK
jgi:hypothetical protein